MSKTDDRLLCYEFKGYHHNNSVFLCERLYYNPFKMFITVQNYYISLGIFLIFIKYPINMCVKSWVRQELIKKSYLRESEYSVVTYSFIVWRLLGVIQILFSTKLFLRAIQKFTCVLPRLELLWPPTL